MAIGDPYASLADLKDYLKISDTTDDTRLTPTLTTVSRGIGQFCRRQFNRAETASARVFAPRSCGVVRVDDFWSADDLAVAVDLAGDGTFTTPVPSSYFRLEPRGGIVNGEDGWPYTRLVATTAHDPFQAEVQVTARWGWAEVPDPVHQATLILASELFKLEGAPFGVAGFGEYGAVRVKQNPIARDLLQPYRRNPVMVG